MGLDEHPTVIKVRRDSAPPPAATQLEAQWLRQVVLDAGADDTGFVEIGRPEFAEERKYVEAIFPAARTLISFTSRMNREPVRSPARSLANVEFHHAGDQVNEIARAVVAENWQIRMLTAEKDTANQLKALRIEFVSPATLSIDERGLTRA